MGQSRTLGRVGVVRAVVSAAAGEELDHVTRVVAERPVVDRLAALLEEDEAVEHVEQLAARLVNRAEDGLAVLGQLGQRLHDGVGRGRVQSGGRLVAEARSA